MKYFFNRFSFCHIKKSQICSYKSCKSTTNVILSKMPVSDFFFMWKYESKNTIIYESIADVHNN